MRQVVIFFKTKQNFGFISSFRTLLLIVLTFVSFCSYAEPTVDILALYRAKDYKGAVKALMEKKKEGPLSYKDYVVLVKSYENLLDYNNHMASLKEAVGANPKKDVFKRELAKALEEKSNSYADNKTYSEVKKSLKQEALDILNDLYIKKPTKENFTSLINFYNREENYEETLGLLELYGRVKAKGKVYYSYLCEAQYKSKLFSSSLKTCKKLTQIYPEKDMGHLYYAKSLEKVGDKELSTDSILKLKGRFPASGSMQLEIGKSLIAKGEYKEGLDHLEKHIALESSDEAMVLKASTLFKMGSYDTALTAYVDVCKQHQEPRRPLLMEIKKASQSLEKKSELRKKYETELRLCKYTYRPKKKRPRGILSGT